MKSDTAACLSVLMLFCISVCRLTQQLALQQCSVDIGFMFMMCFPPASELLCSYRQGSVYETCARVIHSSLATS